MLNIASEKVVVEAGDAIFVPFGESLDNVDSVKRDWLVSNVAVDEVILGVVEVV